MYYTVRHLTKFSYDREISESIMETRMHPRSDENQRCLSFQLSVSPRCRVFSYKDHLQNHVHHFDIPGAHRQLVIVAESLVEMEEPVAVPSALGAGAWDELDAMVQAGDYWEFLFPSEFTGRTELLDRLAEQFQLERRDDPLTVLRSLNEQLYRSFDYVPKSTAVDSPIDVALEQRAGVCQDFTHIMLALVRSRLRIPCRYVSGYLYSDARLGQTDRSVSSATHAWMEALLPQVGWVGFDPTNWLLAGDRHIRTAIGRDYADVPPTHGIYRGRAATELTVAVRVSPSEGSPMPDQELPIPEDWSMLVEKAQQIPTSTSAATSAARQIRQMQQAQQQ